jgi:hypothetical protein
MSGSSDNLLLLLLSLIFRIFRALHDGLSDRGKFFVDDQNYGMVGWWNWHIINWAGRDFFIAMLYIYLLFNNCGWPALALAVTLQFYLHHFFYGWASTHRDLFQ